MSFKQTPEEEFIKELEAYLDIKFDRYSVNRITGYLGDYRKRFGVSDIPIREAKIYNKLVIGKIFEQSSKVEPEFIIQIVSSITGVNKERMSGVERYCNVVMARRVAMYAIRDICKYSLTRIAEIFNKDHSTVIHSIGKVMQRIEQGDEEYLKVIGGVNHYIKVAEEKKTA